MEPVDIELILAGRGLCHGSLVVSTTSWKDQTLLQVLDASGNGIGFLEDGTAGAIQGGERHAPVFLPMEAPLAHFLEAVDELEKLKALLRAGEPILEVDI